MATKPAYITPEVLRWARVRSNLSIRDAASKAAVKADQLESWERNQAKPTLRQAQNLAHALHVPFGYFYLSSPPQDKPLLPDLRTVSDERRNTFSVDFIDVLYDALIKQQWYHDFLTHASADSLPFIGKFSSTNSNESEVAYDISQTLEVTDSLRNEAPSWEAFLTRLIQRAENLGVLILRSGIVKNNTQRILSVEEFRGFAITDQVAPLIFINARDAKAAQIFTLAHELAHLWIGQSGISNPNLATRLLNDTPQVERLCNRIAAQVLVPKETFLMEWRSDSPIRENLARLTKRYRVSSLVILKRALDLGKIAWPLYIKTFKAEKERYLERENKQDTDGGNFYATLGSRNSKQLIRAVVSAAFEGRESFRDAARMLGVKIQTLEKVAMEFGVR